MKNEDAREEKENKLLEKKLDKELKKEKEIPPSDEKAPWKK